MSMTLYGLAASPFVSRVLLVATLKGIDLPLAMPAIDEAFGRMTERMKILSRDPRAALDPVQFMEGTPFMRDVNPQGRMPALTVDGRHLAESMAICDFLDVRFPSPPLMPTDPFERAKVRQICCMCDLSLTSQLLPLAEQIDPLGRDEAKLARTIQEIERSLRELSEVMGPGPWAWGEQASLADCMLLFSVLFFQAKLSTTTENLGVVAFDADRPFPGHPKLRAWWRHLDGHAVFGAAIRRYRKDYDDLFSQMLPDRTPASYGIWFRARAPRS